MTSATRLLLGASVLVLGCCGLAVALGLLSARSAWFVVGVVVFGAIMAFLMHEYDTDVWRHRTRTAELREEHLRRQLVRLRARLESWEVLERRREVLRRLGRGDDVDLDNPKVLEALSLFNKPPCYRCRRRTRHQQRVERMREMVLGRREERRKRRRRRRGC